jgi:hypothetical protein
MADVSVHGGRSWRLGRRHHDLTAAIPMARTPEAPTMSAATAILGGLEAVWHRVDDVRWADPCPHRADHILVGPAGVFVIDVKCWAGALEIGPDTIRHDGHRRHQPLTDVASAAKAIRCLLEPYSAAPVHSMLCFHRDAQIRGTVGSVFVSSTSNLISRLASFPVVLDAIQSRRVADALLQAIAPYETAIEAAGAAITAGAEHAPPKAVRRHWILHRP